MKVIFVILTLFLVLASASRADYGRGMAAYERGDYAEAYKEFKISAEQGNADSQLMLGFLYGRGEGVARDNVQAHKWFNLSAMRGNPNGEEARDTVARKMTAAQIVKAQQLAREWRPIAEVSAKPSEKLSREEIKEIQRMLAELGYSPGIADGLIGAKTRIAIRSYQKDVGLAEDGEASRVLFQHLKESYGSVREKKFRPRRWAEAEIKDERERIQVLVNRLRELIKEAEQKRAADRWVLDRLSWLVRQYDWPWQVIIIEDNFEDGDYTANPSWTVAVGQFFVDEQTGLRSAVEVGVTEPEKREVQPEDLPLAILEAFLKKGEPEEAEKRRSVKEDYAEIYIARDITNAFAISIAVTSQAADQGGLDFGPYQGADRGSGYRLAYSPGAQSKLELLRISYSRSAVVEVYDKPLKLEDGQPHTILWTRDKSGEMTVAVDGNEMFRVADRGFTESFDGFTLVNRGGEYAVREIGVSGMKAD